MSETNSSNTLAGLSVHPGAFSRYDELLRGFRSTKGLDRLNVKDGMILHYDLLQKLHEYFTLGVDGERIVESPEISGTGLISAVGLRVWKFLCHLRQTHPKAQDSGYLFALSAAKLFQNIRRYSPKHAKEAIYGMAVAFSAIQLNGWGSDAVEGREG
ncbi:hypothetical protein ABW20_dc0101815 [Dactylellina cionopaga]|nr:hypothetical protein ABW20_dc0101815 [Dactylellina cionopaga]